MSNKEEFFEILEAVEPIELLNPKTTKKEALKFYAGIMKAFAKFDGDELQFDESDYKKLREVLEEKGCITLDDYRQLERVHPEFFSSGKHRLVELISEPKDLGLPASAAANTINSPKFAIGFCFGKGNWCDEWLKCYEKSLHETKTL